MDAEMSHPFLVCFGVLNTLVPATAYKNVSHAIWSAGDAFIKIDKWTLYGRYINDHDAA